MKISVYITSYNQKEFLEEAIDSVLRQTLMPDEILIVDDASTDGSIELIKNYKKKYPDLIKSYFNLENVGISKCRNIALSNCEGDFVTALDGDDIFLPEKLEIQKDLIKSSRANVVFTNFYYAKDTVESITQKWAENTNEIPSQANFFRDVIARDFPKGALFRNELIETSLLKLVGNYDEELAIYEDFDFRIRLSRVANFAYSIKPLSIYRLHGEGLSRAPKEMHIKTLRRIYVKYQNWIEELSEEDQLVINNSIEVILKNFESDPAVKKVSLLKRIKNKLKNS